MNSFKFIYQLIYKQILKYSAVSGIYKSNLINPLPSVKRQATLLNSPFLIALLNSQSLCIVTKYLEYFRFTKQKVLQEYFILSVTYTSAILQLLITQYFIVQYKLIFNAYEAIKMDSQQRLAISIIFHIYKISNFSLVIQIIKLIIASTSDIVIKVVERLVDYLLQLVFSQKLRNIEFICNGGSIFAMINKDKEKDLSMQLFIRKLINNNQLSLQLNKACNAKVGNQAKGILALITNLLQQQQTQQQNSYFKAFISGQFKSYFQTMEQIIITDEVYQSILTHALLTDAEEILGLLFGQTLNKTVTIYASQSLIRNCKTKDRVEVDEVQLSSAITQAEQIASQINQPTNLTGWYHSHPNITVFPSNVDINTQKNYQGLSDKFIGLIVSIERSKISLIGFQTIQVSEVNSLVLKAKQIPIQIMPKQNVCPQLKLHDFYDAVVEFLQNFYQEEVANYQKQQTQNVLKKVHSASLYQQMLCELLEQVAVPLMQALKDQKNESQINKK